MDSYGDTLNKPDGQVTGDDTDYTKYDIVNKNNSPQP